MILIGVHYHSGDPDALRRQAAARDSLSALKKVRLVNLQFSDGPSIEMEGVETIAALQTDSRKTSGVEGKRTPIVREMCMVLAEIAHKSNIPYFILLNSDEIILQPLVDMVLERGLEGYIFSRMEFSKDTGRDIGMSPGGSGCFVFQTKWWLENHKLFRSYVIGEAYWDNLYTTILLCKARALLLNRTGDFVRHEAHPRVWPSSPYINYTRYLASLDSLYLAIWHRYIARLRELRGTGAGEEDEMTLQQQTFKFQPSTGARLWHVGRCIKAWLRFHIKRVFQKPTPT